MRLLAILITIFTANAVWAANKLEVFTLENRDAGSLVPVISSVVGSEGRVSVDERTNSLIVSYPEEMEANLRSVIATLDRAEPNIRVELISFEAKTSWINQLGLTGRTRLSAKEYQSLLPLLTRSENVSVEQRHQVTTKNNVPARLASYTPGVVRGGPEHAVITPPQEEWLVVTPQVRTNGLIEVQLGSASPSAQGPAAMSRIFTTAVVDDGGALVVGGQSQSSSSSAQDQVPLIPFGVEKSGDTDFSRMTFLHVATAGMGESQWLSP